MACEHLYAAEHATVHAIVYNNYAFQMCVVCIPVCAYLGPAL